MKGNPKVLAELKDLENSIGQINTEILRVLESTKSTASSAEHLEALGTDRITSFNESNRGIIDRITAEMTVQENKMIQLLDWQARQLGIIGRAKD